jgi:hypothetical protein
VTDRADALLIALVLAAAGLVIAAPLLGRYGHPSLADVTMAAAALAGLGAFVLAGVNTVRAARRHHAPLPQADARDERGGSDA